MLNNTTHTPKATTQAATTGLETHTKLASTPGQGGYQQYKVWQENIALHKAGYTQAGVSGRVKTCGTVAIMSGRVALGTIGKGVSVKGLYRCGNRWCPECQPKIASHKALEVERAMEWAVDQGLIPVMYTVTGAHTTTAELEQAGWNLHEAVQGVTVEVARKRMSKAWANTRNGRRGVTLRNQRVGMITAQEVTLDDLMYPGSRTGVHWHRHVLVLLKGQAGQSAHETANAYGEELFDLWQAGCQKVDLKADRDAFDIKVADTKQSAAELGRYVTKYEGNAIAGYSWEHVETVYSETLSTTLHKELTRGDAKNAGRGRVAPEQLLRNLGYIASHAPENTKRLSTLIAQWKDVERGTKGVHWLQWSRGLRDLVGLNDELTDEEIAMTETPVDNSMVAVITWDDLKDNVTELRQAVRASADGEEWSTLLLVLDSYGIDYTLKGEAEWNESVSTRMRAHGNKQR